MPPSSTSGTHTRRRDVERLLDVTVGASAVGLAIGETAARAAGVVAVPVLRLALRPPGVPRGLQPRTWLGALAQLGGVRRDLATERLTSAIDQLVPAVVAQVAGRLDTTALVHQYVDLEAIAADVDVVGLVKEVLADLDLPELIRESSGAMASESVRELRLQGISGDDAIGRAVARLRRRRPTTRPTTRTTTQPSLPLPEPPLNGGPP
jgi:hypothetical protein